MTILLDVAPDLHLPVFMQLKKSLDERQKGVLMTLIDNVNPKEIKISRHWYSKTNHPHLTDELRSKIEPLIGEMLELPHNDTNRFIPLKKLGIYQEGYLFLECIVPKPSLIIAGAGHIGQSLAHLGKFLGFSVTVWDDRPEYATKSQVPDADFVLSGIVDSLADQLQIGDDSYLVIVTHGHKGDTEVLRKFISSKSAYIGMIGSKAKVAQVKMSFLDNEWATPEQWERIYTPIGLDIGAQSVEDIAVSIAAQLVKVRNQKHTPQ
jgi:xanthine dehydrogenase accessory factor